MTIARSFPTINCVVTAISEEQSESTVATQLSSPALASITTMIDPTLDEDKTHQLHDLLSKYHTIFDFPSRPLGQTNAVTHRIDTGTEPPIHHRPYRVSPSERRAIQHEVNKMLSQNVVQSSSSPWSSPVVLVKKKDGSWRFCVDYRKLNKITKKDVYPLPRIDDTLDCLYGAEYFSCIDLRSGYWQISVDESDRENTAFITPDGLFEFKVMPFGLCNAPATFERMMDRLLKGLKWVTCLCYLDDVIIFSDSFSKHLERVQQVLEVFQQSGLQLNSSKCRFGSQQIKVLGHLVDKNGILPDPEKIQAVKDFPKPQSTKDVRSFLGLCSYFRRFIRDFAHIALPLSSLLKKNQPFDRHHQHHSSFGYLKAALTSSPILGHFDDTAPTEIRADASGHGIGAVLAQHQLGTERVIAYASRLLSPAERNYTISERECLAVVWSICKFRPYLFGRPFRVITDHHALCWLSSLKDPIGRLGRWSLRLQEYDFTIVYKSGKMHQDADCLSRYPVSPVDSSEDTELPVLPISDLLNLAQEQRRDPALRAHIEHLTSNLNQPPSGLFRIRNDILYRQNFRPDGLPWLVVVPKHLRITILNELHDVPSSGHLGLLRTYTKVKERFYWPGMYQTVKKYVSSCDPCQRRKKPHTRPSGLLQPLHPPLSPFQRLGVDFLGPFPLSRTDNRWIAVAIDHTTRYAITRALPTSTAVDLANFILEDVILKYGAPRELLSDRGRSFLSRVVSEILQSCSVRHQVTTAYHPQTNGLTERLNRTLSDMLSMYVSSDHSNCDAALPYITFAYNSSRHDTTGFTPFYLLFGREPPLMIDSLLPLQPDASLTAFASDAVSRAEDARQLARLRTLDSQQRQCTRYDSSHQHVSFSPGDLVLLWTPQRHVGLADKLQHRYIGPYRICHKSSDVTYVIEPLHQQNDGRRKQRDTVHVLRLKPYIAPSAP